MKRVSITKLKTYLLEHTNNDDLTMMEVVDRYVELVRLYRRMEREIKKDGTRIIVRNGAQEYIKSHPLISESRNINAQLVNLKRDIDNHIETFKEQQEKETAEYDAGDLM